MLTDKAVQSARPKQKPYKKSDRGGLYLYVSTAGARSWRYDYRVAGKRETLTLGLYPAVGLAQARESHREARALVSRGASPVFAKKRKRAEAIVGAANTVRAVGDSWYAALSPHRGEVWRDSTRRWLDARIYPALGARPVKDVEPADILALITQIAKDHPKTAEGVRQTIARIFSHAIRNLCTKQNPARELAGAIIVPPPKHHKHFSAKELPGFLEKLDKYPGRRATQLAIWLLILTMVRKRELVQATWNEVDFEAVEWRVGAERMKMKAPHVIPLSRQAFKAFKELKTLSCGSRYVLPNIGRLDKPMSASTLNAALHRMKTDVTPHGMRATASTLMNEHEFNADAVERQLAHAERSSVRRAYNHAEMMPARKAMLQWWADFLERPANVVDLKRARKARA